MQNSNLDSIMLDEKTKLTVHNLNMQIRLIQDKVSAILQTVINVKYPESDDIYELSNDGSMLIPSSKEAIVKSEDVKE